MLSRQLNNGHTFVAVCQSNDGRGTLAGVVEGVTKELQFIHYQQYIKLVFTCQHKNENFFLHDLPRGIWYA